MSVEAAAEAVRAALAEARRGLIGRDALVELVALAAVAGEHLLVIGPPGTAKSEAVRRVSRALGGDYFEYLLGRFTEPSEVFGPVDLAKLRAGTVETRTAGMLPEAQIAFLDEVFLGSTAILNTLLGMLNERRFRRGHTVIECPLRVCVGASNALPEDEALAAFADRFLLRTFVAPIDDALLEDLLEGGWSLRPAARAVAHVEHLDALRAQARGADLTAVRPALARALRLLRSAGVELSDRRMVKVQRVVAAAAVLDGRAQPGPGDLWPLIYAVPTAEQQQVARDVLRPVLEEARNAALGAATEAASLSPASRAQRLAERARALLDARPADEPALTDWRLSLEGVARAIDAGFPPDALPEPLPGLRAEVVTALDAAR